MDPLLELQLGAQLAFHFGRSLGNVDSPLSEGPPPLQQGKIGVKQTTKSGWPAINDSAPFSGRSPLVTWSQVPPGHRRDVHA